jgi:DNA-binding MarR family transcriptional regulator
MKIKKYISQSPIFALYRAHTIVLESFQKKLSGHGIHLLQGLILTAIFFEDKEVRPLELHNVLGVERSNLSHALRGLEKMGFLKRSMHSTDARGYVFSLSPTGRKLTLTLIKEFDSIQDLFEKSMGIKKTKEIMDGIQQLISIYRNGP